MSEMNERVARLEQKVESLCERTGNLGDNTTMLYELKGLMELQQHMNNEQHLIIKDFRDTLKEMGTNLALLNKSQENMQREIAINSNRIEKVEKDVTEQNDKSKIDVVSVLKNNIIALIGLPMSAITTAIIAYVLYKLGLK